MNQFFTEELVKLADRAALLRNLKGRAVGKALSSHVRGAMLGASVGAGTGLLGDTEPGESRAGRVVRGAIAGGTLGAGAGAIGRTATDYRLLHPGASATETAAGVARATGKSLKNFGKRQLHGFTGAYGDKLTEIGMPSAARAQKDVHLARLRAEALLKQDPANAEKIRAGLQTRIRDITDAGIQGERRARAGITSLPGVMKGLATKPTHTAKELAHAATGGGVRGAAFAVGLPAAFAAPSLARGDESEHGGPSMTRKMTMLGTNIAGGVATAGLPFLPQAVASSAIDAAVAHRRPRVPVPAALAGVDSEAR